MFSLLEKYELRGAKRRVRLFNRFRIESVLKIAPYHTLKFGGIGKLAYLCTVVQRKACAPAKSTFNIQHSTLKLKIMEVKGTLKYRKVQRTPQTGENAGKKKWYATSVTDRSPRCITHRGLFFTFLPLKAFFLKNSLNFATLCNIFSNFAPKS